MCKCCLLRDLEQLDYNKVIQSWCNVFDRLLDEKRVDIVTGGWVMTDEAVSHYAAMLDQLVEGHLWLQQTLGWH